MRFNIKILFLIGWIWLSPKPVTSFAQGGKAYNISKEVLQDKIKGGWAGQTIGVTYGGPTEFDYLGRVIPDTVNIPWGEDYVEEYFITHPGIYDDIYMDLTFVKVIEEEGIKAPVSSFADAFANAGFKLWHANQAARYELLHGIAAPASGHWKNNLHSDCIDFQIEADFAGLMSPGMPNAASEMCDRVGHIMNYGDGWYAGVFVAALYSWAFVSDDIDFIVKSALRSIPKGSNYYQCMAQVLMWYSENPNDWKASWQEIQNADWKESCPKGIDRPFNIEATTNSAYVLLGLLYGRGDWYETLSIATRSGQDSDCNPSTCAGILGVISGYENIPNYWKKPIEKVDELDFKYTSISLTDIYRMGVKHAIEMIKSHQGSVNADTITIKIQQPVPVPFEQSPTWNTHRISLFSGNSQPLKKRSIRDFTTSNFEGTGIVINGEVVGNKNIKNYIAEVEFIIDDEVFKTMKLPLEERTRSVELFWDRQLGPGKHQLKIKWLNPQTDIDIILESAITYNGYRD